MKIVIFLQARMSSQRLPGKMMLRVLDKPIVGHVMDRLRLVNSVDDRIVLTSLDTSDDAISRWCEESGEQCFRGALIDVYARFVQALRHFQPDAFVRICGDSPMIDARLIDEVVAVFNAGRCDMATNVLTRSYPRGQSVEVIKASMFLKYNDEITTPEDREHVTSYFYRHAGQLNIKNVLNPSGDFSSKSLCVDTKEDLARFERVVGYFKESLPSQRWRDCLNIADRVSLEVN